MGRYADPDAGRIAAARKWAAEFHRGEARASGEPAIAHSERVAATLAGMGLDADAVMAGLLHQSLDGGKIAKPALAELFGERCAELVAGASRLSALKAKNKTIQAAETIRKMLFAMAGDIRVILIQLADKLDSMRTLRWLPEADRRRIAAECLDIFAPLADRLGVSWLKDELEDLALKEINREAYDQIKLLVAGKKGEREAFLDKASGDLSAAAAAEGYSIETSYRAKHFYSIYQKMRKRAKGTEELFDLSGIRVICGTEGECYAILGIAHRLWKPLDGRFKDYIAMPKSNGYRSLHTTVMAYDGKLLEIQIRTAQMHQLAEFGVASHWLYKKGQSREREAELPVVNRLKDWNALLDAGDDFLEDIKREMLGDSIFVFTPKGDAIELPAGSTPLDFAYAIHSDVGNRCLSAKANGAIIPLNAELKNTQVVEIQTGNNARPNVNWLKAVKTGRARSRIRAWLVGEGHVLAVDKNVVARKREEKEPRPEDKGRQAQERRPELEVRHSDSEPQAPGVLDYRPYRPNEVTDSSHAGIAIKGAGNLMVRFAGCCKPAAGDRITGYVSRGRGIIVHREGCRNLPGISEFAERRVDVSWETTPGLVRRYRVSAKRSLDLFSEIENAAKKHGGKLMEGKLEDGHDGLSGTFTMAFPGVEEARVVERNLRQVPNIVKIRRLD